jgi:hypothetical protein
MLEPLSSRDQIEMNEALSILLAHKDPEIVRRGRELVGALLRLAQFPVERRPLIEGFRSRAGASPADRPLSGHPAGTPF